MKKITLLVASIFLVGSMANASENPVFSDKTTIERFGFDEPIAFTERGVEFYVFPNGEFDFNTRPQDSQSGDYHYKTAGRRVVVATERHAVNYGIRIEHDSFGRVRRIGNTFINYDFNDRVSRIGSVFMRYNRFALSQVGGLQIVYNRRGQIVDFIGVVKGNRSYYNYNNSNNHQYQNGHYSNINSDYYYKNGASRKNDENLEKVDELDTIQEKK